MSRITSASRCLARACAAHRVTTTSSIRSRRAIITGCRQFSHPCNLSTDRSRIVPAVHILAGGSLESPLDVVKPGLLSALPGANDIEQATAWNTVPERTEGRRLALAKWIASPNNTLTARVIVNRIWQQ